MPPSLTWSELRSLDVARSGLVIYRKLHHCFSGAYYFEGHSVSLTRRWIRVVRAIICTFLAGLSLYYGYMLSKMDECSNEGVVVRRANVVFFSMLAAAMWGWVGAMSGPGAIGKFLLGPSIDSTRIDRLPSLFGIDDEYIPKKWEGVKGRVLRYVTDLLT
jgi:hypothetical protein